MNTTHRARRGPMATGVLALGSTALLLTGCGLSSATTDDAAVSDSNAAAGFPLTAQNCGADVEFAAAPERVVLLKSAAVPFLSDLGVMDRVTARAGLFPTDYYDEETVAELDAIKLLTEETDSGGHLQISKEVVISEQPDLVLGEVDNLSRSTLSAVDIPLIEEPALCEVGAVEPSFDDIYAQMSLYGEIFDQAALAEAENAELQTRVEGIVASVDAESGRTAAVLYPTVGGGTTYAYGSLSMASPQVEAAGFENVYGDVDERVFEVTTEELLGRNPDVLILLYTDGDPEQVQAAIENLPGAESLKAVRNGDVMTQLFNFTEPASPLTIDGLEMIVERFGTGS